MSGGRQLYQVRGKSEAVNPSSVCEGQDEHTIPHMSFIHSRSCSLLGYLTKPACRER
jgi:hypothetical protein